MAATILARNVLDHAAARDPWRRTHQTSALISHYRRRGDPLPQDLRILNRFYLQIGGAPTFSANALALGQLAYS